MVIMVCPELIKRGKVMYSLPPGCITSNSPTITCNPSKPGNYTISCTVTDSTGKNVSVHGNLRVSRK